MPPEAANVRPASVSSVPSPRPVSPTRPALRHLIISQKFYRGTIRIITGKRLILILVFILSSFSILRLLRILLVSTTFTSARPSVLSPSPERICSPPSPSCSGVESHVRGSSKGRAINYASKSVLTEKEFQLLKKIVSRRAPCNLLVFGLQPQFLMLSSINANGTNIFLEDDQEKINAIGANSIGTTIHKVEHKNPGKDAYKLLKHARKNRACTSFSFPLQDSKCKLAIRDLPKEVYESRWDVIFIDGPSGHSLEAPGRMSVIYTASVLARFGNITNVLVHDIDRIIERWFSWEFLCEENLASSKGKLWNFKIIGQENYTGFCSNKPVSMH